ncbi:MAG: helicase-associated domain-containing protein, partial [Fibrobacterota bacterium]
MPNLNNPLILQGDRSLLLEVNNPLYEEVRDALAPFAELVKSPEHVHTYRITPLSLWNAAAVGHTLDTILQTLQRYSKYEVPQNMGFEIKEYYERYGKVRIEATGAMDTLVLTAETAPLLAELLSQKGMGDHGFEKAGPKQVTFPVLKRGILKQALIKIGYPAEDLAGYVDGDPHPIALREKSLEGELFTQRDYQKASAEVFYASG